MTASAARTPDSRARDTPCPDSGSCAATASPAANQSEPYIGRRSRDAAVVIIGRDRSLAAPSRFAVSSGGAGTEAREKSGASVIQATTNRPFGTGDEYHQPRGAASISVYGSLS